MTEWRSLFEQPDALLHSLWFSVPVVLYLGRLFYGSWWSFLEALRYLYQPGWLSFLRGEYENDQWATVVFYCYAMLSGLIIYGSYRFAATA